MSLQLDRLFRVIGMIGLFTVSLSVQGSGGVPASTNFEGYLTDLNGQPVADGGYNIRLQIRGGTCVIYEEIHNAVPVTDGVFSVRMGTGTRQTGDSGVPWVDVFSRNEIPGGAVNCSSGHTFTSQFTRSVRVAVNNVVLEPDYIITSAPFATKAERANSATLAQSLRSEGSVPGEFVGLTGPLSGGDGTIYRLPPIRGLSGQILTTDDVGNLSWSTGVPGSGITSINGLTSTVQTFSTGSAGTAPAFTSDADVHTLHLPLANNAGVTAGLISNADFDIFNAKQDESARLTELASMAPLSDHFLTGNGSSFVLRTPTDARTALGLGTAATVNITDFLVPFQNLNDLTDPVAARANLGLGTAALLNEPDVLKTSGVQPMGGNLNMSNNRIENLATPVSSSDAATKEYVDNSIGAAEGNFVRVDGTQPLVSDWDVGGFNLNNFTATFQNGSAGMPPIRFDSGSGTGIYSPITGHIGFSTGGTTRVIITESGNVGIGTNSPVAPLTVEGSTVIQGNLQADQINVSGEAFLETVHVTQLLRLNPALSPGPCQLGMDGMLKLTPMYVLCVCKEAQSQWFRVSDGTTQSGCN